MSNVGSALQQSRAPVRHTDAQGANETTSCLNYSLAMTQVKNRPILDGQSRSFDIASQSPPEWRIISVFDCHDIAAPGLFIEMQLGATTLKFQQHTFDATFNYGIVRAVPRDEFLDDGS